MTVGVGCGWLLLGARLQVDGRLLWLLFLGLGTRLAGADLLCRTGARGERVVGGGDGRAHGRRRRGAGSRARAGRGLQVYGLVGVRVGVAPRGEKLESLHLLSIGRSRVVRIRIENWIGSRTRSHIDVVLSVRVGLLLLVLRRTDARRGRASGHGARVGQQLEVSLLLDAEYAVDRVIRGC